MNRRNAMKLLLAPIMLGVVPALAKTTTKRVVESDLEGFPIMFDVNGKRMSQVEVNKSLNGVVFCRGSHKLADGSIKTHYVVVR